MSNTGTGADIVSTGSDLYVNYNNGEDIILGGGTSGGNTGVGTITPSAKLHIYEQTAEAESLRVETLDQVDNTNPLFGFYQGAIQTSNSTSIKSLAISTDVDKTYQVMAYIIGSRADEVATDTGSYILAGTFKNSGGTLTQLGSTTTVHSAEDNSSYDASIGVGGTNIEINVTGLTGRTVDWFTTATVNAGNAELQL